MKFLTERQKAWNILHSELEQKREQKSKIRRSKRKSERSTRTGSYELVPLVIPERFNLRKNLGDALEFFGKLRKVILIDKKLGLINFEHCKSISAGAGLILAAEADRCRTLRYRDGKPTVTGNYPQDDGLRRFLDDLGFFRLLKIRSHVSGHESGSPARFIAMRSGRRDKGEEVHYVTEVLNKESVQLDEAAKEALYEGLLEAMNNVTTHAYPENQPKSLRNRLPVLGGQWWAAGHWDHEKKEIGVLIYDQGVGIPATLPNNRHKAAIAEIRKLLRLGNSDPECIRVAMEIGKSGLTNKHRGHGMASLRHAVRLATRGHLLILSGAGGYLYTEDGNEKTFPLPTSVGGTFIEWRIRDSDLITWGNVDRRNN